MRFASIVSAVSLAATVCGKEMAKDAVRAAGKFSVTAIIARIDTDEMMQSFLIPVSDMRRL